MLADIRLVSVPLTEQRSRASLAMLMADHVCLVSTPFMAEVTITAEAIFIIETTNSIMI